MEPVTEEVSERVAEQPAAAAPSEHRPVAGSVLGSLAVFLFVLAGVTGLVLMTSYRPTVAHAYGDVVDLREASALGFVRGLHYWGAQALVIVVWLHLLRVVLRGFGRLSGWRDHAVSVALLVLSALLAASGAALPLDEVAYGSIALLWPAGEIDGAVLLACYALHCAVLPALTVALLLDHRRRARRGER